MLISIKNYINEKGIEGNLLLYRDSNHKKKGLCEFLAQKIKTDKPICVKSSGAFGLYMAKAFPNNQIVLCGKPTSEYRKQLEKLSNVTINEEVRETFPATTKVKDYADANGYFYLNQFDEPLVKEYYKQHFESIVSELCSTKVDAFCDCGHSCATMTGFIEAGLVGWWFVLGVNNSQCKRTTLHHLTGKEELFQKETTLNFDTELLKSEIETRYPSFGNIYEATRSISAAMSWLLKNPGKTVLVYVGDSPVYGEDATI